MVSEPEGAARRRTLLQHAWLAAPRSRSPLPVQRMTAGKDIYVFFE